MALSILKFGLFALLGVFLVKGGADAYVSDGGHDDAQGDGTSGKPYKTLAKAATGLDPAGTIYIGASPYTITGNDNLAKELTVTKAASINDACTMKITKGFTVNINNQGVVTFKDLTLESTATDGDKATVSLLSVADGGALTLEKIVVSAAYLDGVSLIGLTSGGSVTLKGSKFTAASTTKAAVLDGTVANGKTVTIQGCTFTSCTSASGKAGALNLDVTGTLTMNALSVTVEGSTTTTANTFQTCYVGANGDNNQLSLYVKVTSRTTSVTMESIEFKNAVPTKGELVLFETANGDEKVKPCATGFTPSYKTGAFAGCYKRATGDTEAATKVTLASLRGEDPEAFVTTNGLGSSCLDSTENNACPNIKAALDLAETKAVIIAGTTFTVGASVEFAKAVSVTKVTATPQCEVTVGATFQFQVKHAVEFSHLSFTSGGDTGVAMWAVSGENGQLTLLSCDVKNVKLTGTPSLITLDGTSSLDLKDTIFNAITKSSGNGPVLDLDVAKGNTVSIDHCSFSSCKATGEGGSGGALAFTTDSFDAITMSNCYFEGNAFGTNGKGKNVLITNTVAIANNPFTDCYTNEDAATVHTTLGSGADNKWIAAGYIVDKSKTESTQDGSLANPYKSFTPAALQKAVLLVAPGGVDVDNTGVTLGTPIIVSSMRTDRAPVGFTAGGTFTVNAETAFKSLAFTGTSVSFSATVFDVKKKFTLHDCTLTSFTLTGASLIELTGGDLYLYECEFTTISTSATNKAGVLTGTLGAAAAQTVEIKGCTFTTCTAASGGKAGALAFTLSGTGDNAKGSLTFDAQGDKKNTFSGCNTDENKQDAISIEITSQHNTLKVNNIEFKQYTASEPALISVVCTGTGLTALVAAN